MNLDVEGRRSARSIRRRMHLLLPGIALVLLAAGALLGWRGAGHASFERQGPLLSARWGQEQRQGRRARRVAPLRAELATLEAGQSGWLWHPWRGADTSAVDRLS